ncbi:MAG: HAD-IA family hydrolase, partial [Clostridiales bacterium]|nr:HAD-IA family hydrolase [Candidatus Blautia equi]
EQMLATLARRKYKLAIASSKPEVYIKRILEHWDLLPYFDVVTGSELDGRRSKKAEVIEETLERLGMSGKRDQVIMVGDKEHDILGAREAGIPCIAVSYGYGSMRELAEADPVTIVSEPMDVCSFLYKRPVRKRSIMNTIGFTFWPVLLIYLLQAIVAIFAVSIRQELYYKGHQISQITVLLLSVAVSSALTSIILWFFLGRDKEERKDCGLIKIQEGKLTLPDYLRFLLAGSGIMFLLNYIVTYLSDFLYFLKGGNESINPTIIPVESTLFLPFIVFCVGILAPLAEEIVFRGIVFARLRDRMKLQHAAWISAVVFGIMHGNLKQGIYAALMGYGLALMVEWTGKLRSAVLMHMAANTMAEITELIHGKLGDYQDGVIIYMLVMVFFMLVGILSMQYYQKRYNGKRYI